MEWEGGTLSTIGEILKAALACKNKEEAALFMLAYSTTTSHASENLGYMAGYCSDEEAQRIYNWFNCEHPIFGKTKPSTEDALKAGCRIGELSKTTSAVEAMKIAKAEYVESTTTKNSFFTGINAVLENMRKTL